MWLLDENENIKRKLTLLSAIHTEELNSENSLSFECLEKVEKMDRVIYQDSLDKWHEFIVQEVVESKDSNRVYAENSIFELHGDFIEDKRPEGTPLRHLNAILEKTRWSVGIIDGFPTKKASYYRMSAYEALSKMCDVFNAYRTYEIKVTGNKIAKRIINISSKSGEDNGKRFTYSKDLIDVERTILLGDVVTALYGFGRGEEIGDGYGRRINFGELNKPDSPLGAMYVEDKDALQKYGRNSPNGKVHVFGKWEFDDIDDKELLYQATKEKLQELNKPRINYRADVILLNEKHENVRVGDVVSIIDKNFRGTELRLKGIVFKIERDLLKPENSVVELGNYIANTADADNELRQFVSTVRSKTNVWDRSNAFDENGKLKGSQITDLLEVWNAELNSAGGFVYAEAGQGIITYDAPIDENPTSAIQITGAGFRIANSKKSNGEWDWKTIGTGDGIFGEHIMAGSITTNHLSSDVGSALDISSNESVNILIEDKVVEKVSEIEIPPGPPGQDAVQWTIGTDGYWYADGIKTDKKAIGEDGRDADIWTIGPNGNWFKNDVDTGQPSKGPKGDKGDQGIQGPKGADGTSQYVHIRYSANANGSNFVTSPTSGTKYIGIANTTSSTAPTSAGSYAWSKYVGEDGSQGPQGIQGPKGENGQPTYTWVKYADTPTSGMSDYPDGKKYIGLAFNKTTQTESTDYSEYQWSLMPQNIEIGGRNYFVRANINNIAEASNILRSGSSWKGYSFSVNEGEQYTIHRTDTTNNRWRFYWVYTDEVEGSETHTTAFSNDSQESYVPNTVKAPSGAKWGHLYLSNSDSDGSTIPDIMIEKGNVATDWTPAPEDVQNEIIRVETEATAKITANTESISLEKSERETQYGTLEDIVSEQGSSITLLNDQINTTIETRLTDAEGTIENINETVSTVEGTQQTFTDRITNLEGEMTEQQTFFRTGMDGLTIGGTDWKTVMHADGERISFQSQTGNVEAQFGSGGMYVNRWETDFHTIEKFEEGSAKGTIFKNRKGGS